MTDKHENTQAINILIRMAQQPRLTKKDLKLIQKQIDILKNNCVIFYTDESVMDSVLL